MTKLSSTVLPGNGTRIGRGTSRADPSVLIVISRKAPFGFKSSGSAPHGGRAAAVARARADLVDGKHAAAVRPGVERAARGAIDGERGDTRNSWPEACPDVDAGLRRVRNGDEARAQTMAVAAPRRTS